MIKGFKVLLTISLMAATMFAQPAATHVRDFDRSYFEAHGALATVNTPYPDSDWTLYAQAAVQPPSPFNPTGGQHPVAQAVTPPQAGYLDIATTQDLIAGKYPPPATLANCWDGTGKYLGQKDVNVGGVVSLLGPFEGATFTIDPTGRLPYGYSVDAGTNIYTKGDLILPGGSEMNNVQAARFLASEQQKLTASGSYSTPIYRQSLEWEIKALQVYLAGNI